MKTEFMIGNWVLIPTNEEIKIPCLAKRVKGITRFGELDFTEPEYPEEHLVPITHVSGISLTPEWLEKAGFMKVKHIHGYSFYKLGKSKVNKCHIDVYENRTEYMGYLVNHCKYVHQLQNLYFTLTGKELELHDKR